jgi:hypothetical protein
VIKKRVDKRAKELSEKFKSENIEIIGASSFVNFFGKESLGIRQTRGMGNLFLTKDVLFFEMWKPKREFNIPIGKITGCEITKWHLKKSKGKNLLKVLFTNEKGEKDSVAWLIRNLDEWKSFMDKIVENNQKK